MFVLGPRMFALWRPASPTSRAQSSVALPLVQPDFLNGGPHKKHPGVTNLKTLQLPEELQKGALMLIHAAQVNSLADRARRLSNLLWSRKRKVEDAQLRARAKTLEKSLLEAEKSLNRDEDESQLEARIRKKVFYELRRTTYHWSPLRYDEELGVVYMASRLAGGYAAVKRALYEIKKRDPAFSPHSLLDFGSGLGTAVWASHSLWPDSLKEMVCVDSSGAMNSLSDQLLRGGSEKNNPLIKEVYFRQFLPVSPKAQSDLVVAAFTLSELGSCEEREEATLTLWRKTSSYLVLVEHGTLEGYQILMEARESLLKNQDKVVVDKRKPSVFAPCPHELPCPLHQVSVPCNFIQSYCPLPLPGSPERLQEKFSYLIMARTKIVGDIGSEGLAWARLTAPVLRKPRHVHCQLCCSSGELRHVVVTARHHGRDTYRCARNSDWGDRLPVAVVETCSGNIE